MACFGCFEGSFFTRRLSMSSGKEVHDDVMAPMTWGELFECLATSGLLSGFCFPAGWLLLDRLLFGEDDVGRFYRTDAEAVAGLWICGSIFILSFAFLIMRVVIRKRKMHASNAEPST